MSRPKYLAGELCNKAYAVASRAALDYAYPPGHRALGLDGTTRYDFWASYDGCFFE